MTPLVLSLFPGIGLLDRAFEEEGFCVVRGPDLLWGGDVKRFHAPVNSFEGIIGGPPCQKFSALRHLVAYNRAKAGGVGFAEAEDLIPEFERVVGEGRPQWFVMENVPQAPEPHVDGYIVDSVLLRDSWVGGKTSRLRRFSYGTRVTQLNTRVLEWRRLAVDVLALYPPDVRPAVCASGGYRDVPVKIGGSGKVKKTAANNLGYTNAALLADALDAQGLPANFFEHSPFTASAKHHMIGNGVPLPMGRAIARAVRQAMGYVLEERTA
jgi:DNA (cytosine-5)-methyltransferase 1